MSGPADPRSADDRAKEHFERRSAVTVAILAALLAVASMYASNATSDAQLAATRAADQWSYYQSKSVKEHTFEVERDLAGILNPSAVDEAKREAFVESCTKQAEKNTREKDKAKEDAEAAEKAIDLANRSGNRFSLGVLLLQMAVVVGSVSLLVRRTSVWLMSVLLGLAGALIAATPLLPLPKPLGGL